MTDSLPEPLTPADCDLRDFGFMPLEIERLRRSKAWVLAKREPGLAFYMLNLWAAAFHEHPAGSLEDDDDVLIAAAECEPRRWRKVRDKILRGWIKCSDGRLYHPVVAEKALEAWIEKLGQRKSSGAGNAKRWGVTFDATDTDRQIAQAVRLLTALNPHSRVLHKRTARSASGVPAGDVTNPDGTPIGIPSGSQGTSKGSSVLRTAADAANGGVGNERARPSTPVPLDNKTWLFRDGLLWLTKATGRAEPGLRSQLGRWLRDAKEDATALRAIFATAQDQDVAEPVAWITQAIATRQQAAAPFEQTDEHGWRMRFQSFAEHHVWPPTWGGAKPGDHPQHPAHLLAEYGHRKSA